MKKVVYQTQPQSIAEHRFRITDECKRITPEIFGRIKGEIDIGSVIVKRNDAHF